MTYSTITTLSGAVAVDQNTITVTSAAGCNPGMFCRIDQETLKVASSYVSGTTIPVLRGRDSSATQAHQSGAQVQFFQASDQPSPSPGQQYAGTPITSPSRSRISYSASGAITLPSAGNDMDAVLNGTVALAMTIANPTLDMDGCRLAIFNNGVVAHTVTYTAGLGNVGATADVMTWKATQAQALVLIACGGFWVGTGNVAGAATIAGVGIG